VGVSVLEQLDLMVQFRSARRVDMVFCLLMSCSCCPERAGRDLRVDLTDLDSETSDGRNVLTLNCCISNHGIAACIGISQVEGLPLLL
jgi:hypothetical protein